MKMRFQSSRRPKMELAWSTFWLIFFVVVLFLIGFLWRDKVGSWGSRLFAVAVPASDEKVVDMSPDVKLERDLLRYENERLRALLGENASLQNGKFTLTRVLTRPPKTPYDTFIVSGGRDKGYREGDLVYSDYRTMIGKIAAVYNKQSVVLLFSTAGIKTDGELSVAGKVIPVSLIGKGGNNFEIILPTKLKVEVGDYIFVPEDQATILAQVAEIEPDEAETVNHIKTQSPSNVFSLPWLLVKKQ